MYIARAVLFVVRPLRPSWTTSTDRPNDQTTKRQNDMQHATRNSKLETQLSINHQPIIHNLTRHHNPRHYLFIGRKLSIDSLKIKAKPWRRKIC